MTTSVDYYNNNAQAFFDGTCDVDMSAIYDRFLPLIPTGGTILDAGCGSGRDSRVFISKGYAVTAFDASRELVALARSINGVPASVATFTSFSSEQLYDGIWACASLLHLPRAQLVEAITGLAELLAPKGVFYLSFKRGVHERLTGGRQFTDLTDEMFGELVARIQNLSIRDCWVTEDARIDRSDKWLNAILEVATIPATQQSDTLGT